MSRPRRQPTWVYVDEEFGHVPALPGPEPRARHRHSRAQVRAARERAIARARAIVGMWHIHPAMDAEVLRQRGLRALTNTRTPYGYGNSYERGWTKGVRHTERRLLDAETADLAAALRCDGYDPEPPEPRDEYGRLAELCNLMEEAPCPQ